MQVMLCIVAPGMKGPGAGYGVGGLREMLLHLSPSGHYANKLLSGPDGWVGAEIWVRMAVLVS